MQTAISIIIALIIFGVLVLIHEFGHFIVAKKNGVVVNEFSIGMGPRIFSRVAKSGTRYSIKILPLGGSCAMLGEDEDNEEEGSFNSKSIWARSAIIFAGPFFNFILAFVLALIVIGAAGADPAYVLDIASSSPAYQAGLRNGDKIVNFNGSSVSVGREIALEEFCNPLNGSEVSITYERDGKQNTITYKPNKKYMVGMTYTQTSGKARVEAVAEKSAFDKAGIKAGDIIKEINGTKIATGNTLKEYLLENPFSDKISRIKVERNGKVLEVNIVPEESGSYETGFVYNQYREKQSFLNVIKYSFIEEKYQITMVLKSLKMLVTGKVSANEVSGPVGIVSAIGDTYTQVKDDGVVTTLLTMLNLAIMLSANLGVMNLLPIPALDGGRLFLYLIEIITRKKIPKDKEGMIHFVGFILLMALMVFLVFNDIRKLL